MPMESRHTRIPRGNYIPTNQSAPWPLLGSLVMFLAYLFPPFALEGGLLGKQRALATCPITEFHSGPMSRPWDQFYQDWPSNKSYSRPPVNQVSDHRVKHPGAPRLEEGVMSSEELGYGECCHCLEENWGKGRKNVRAGADVHHVALLRSFLKPCGRGFWQIRD